MGIASLAFHFMAIVLGPCVLRLYNPCMSFSIIVRSFMDSALSGPPFLHIVITLVFDAYVWSSWIYLFGPWGELGVTAAQQPA
jgi:hypothetical protein